MSAADDARRVSIGIADRVQKSKLAILALAESHRGAMQDEFLNNQPAQQGAVGKYWTNRTSDARNRVFSEVINKADAVGFFMAHGIDYGVYLELANDRQNEALRPLIEKYGRAFIERVRKLLA
jgi:hypothetical protein